MKKRSLLLLVLMVVLTTTSVYAKKGTEKITVSYMDIQVMLNGYLLDLKDAKGNAVEPFVYNGTTYLPVRNVAEALEIPVEWDSQTATVILGEKPEGRGTKLEDIGIFSGEYSEKYSFITFDVFNTNLGVKAYDGYMFNASNYSKSGGEATFLMNGQYSTFDFTIAMSDYNVGQSVEKIGAIKIWGDDKLIYESSELHSDLIDPVLESIDISNVIKLKIEVPRESSEWRYYGILNPTVY